MKEWTLTVYSRLSAPTIQMWSVSFCDTPLAPVWSCKALDVLLTHGMHLLAWFQFTNWHNTNDLTLFWSIQKLTLVFGSYGHLQVAIRYWWAMVEWSMWLRILYVVQMFSLPWRNATVLNSRPDRLVETHGMISVDGKFTFNNRNLHDHKNLLEKSR